MKDLCVYISASDLSKILPNAVCCECECEIHSYGGDHNWVFDGKNTVYCPQCAESTGMDCSKC